MGLLENVREAAELAKSLGNIDLYSQIVDLKDQILELRDENRELKDENRRLRESSAIEDEIERRGSVYYHRLDDGVEKGPYCMSCWDADRRLISVSSNGHRYSELQFRCAKCGAEGDMHRDPNQPAPKKQRVKMSELSRKSRPLN